MKKLTCTAIAIAFVSLGAGPALAAPPASNVPASPTELLNQIQARVQGKTPLYKKHRSAYLAASPERRRKMMAQAQARLHKAKAASARAANKFSKKSAKIGALANKLSKKVDELNLSAVFSFARKGASNAATVFQGSLIATQLEPPMGEPDRLTFLYNLANQDTVPTMTQLQRLWYELQRGLTAQGKVVRYRAPVVMGSGTTEVSSVLRIGPFTASAKGRFLQYIPTLKVLSVLPRQLPGGAPGALWAFIHTNADYALGVVDPSSGGIMQMKISAPTWEQRLEIGGVVVKVILVILIIGLILFLIQLARLVYVRVRFSQQLRDLGNLKKNNPLGRVLRSFNADPETIEEESGAAELRITEAVLKEEPKLTRFQSYLRLAVASGPLLGLIGTVTGMILTFQTITATGSADPRLMATGIGHAMIATVVGLVCAIVLLFGVTLLKALSDGMMQTLEKESNGMLAEELEKQRNA